MILWLLLLLAQRYHLDGDVTLTPLTTTTTIPLPSQRLDLTNWKITLPVDTNADGKADEVTQPKLASFQLPPWFLAVPGGVQFRAAVGGATTSGSGYPRSELREMNGNNLAAWGTNDGHRHRLTIREAITHVPDVKREIVCAQIHDASDDVVEIRLSGPRLFVEASESGTSRDLGTLDPAYVLGTPFALLLDASSGIITVTYNGVLKVTYPRLSTGDYFKAGAYPQSNVSKGDAPTAYGEVVISTLLVDHQ